MKKMKNALWALLFGLNALHSTQVQAKPSYRDMIAPYLFFVQSEEQKAYSAAEQQAYQAVQARPYPSAKDTYKSLNKNPNDRFAVSFGTAMSQTEVTNNTMHPDNMRQYIQAGIQRAAAAKEWFFKKTTPGQKAYEWLHKERNWYALNAAKPVHCNSCQATTNPARLSSKHDGQTIDNALHILANNQQASELELNQCPQCQSNDVVQQTKQIPQFTAAHQDAMVAQAKHLGVFDQYGVQNGDRPNYRLSVEMANIVDDTGKVIPAKLDKQANFLQRFGNLMAFGQHYSKTKPNQFENKQDIEDFANYSAELIKANPNITHYCPISQVIAMGIRTARQYSLPPFTSNMDHNQLLQNLAEAQTASCKAVKKTNPDITTMLSHQYKPFRKTHTFNENKKKWLQETIACFAANKIYNKPIKDLFQNKQNSFDALALSLYPAMYFNGFEPSGGNCSGTIDPTAALESIMRMHKDFPKKDIYIVETGCNTEDPAKKKEFIDMTLHACKLARDLGAPVKGCYFWAHTNDRDFYTEWNNEPGTSNFSPYDKLDPANPCGSINAGGDYLREILESQI